jgi:hypothetical protein
MAHTRKDTLTRTRDWARHLRADGKHTANRGERRAARREIARECEELGGGFLLQRFTAIERN